MLLYIHVPFCRKRCAYCSFYSLPIGTTGTASTDFADEYARSLLREMTLWQERLGKIQVETVFFGGGTPSLLPAGTIGTILRRIDKLFSLAASAEISLEANPDSFLAPGYAQGLKAAGVGRVSLGVQSLNPAHLQRLGRVHDARQAIAAARLARKTGFSSLSLDCIWGLPGQSQRSWLEELEQFIALQPDHLSCYGLTLEEGTPLAEQQSEGRFTLPAEREQASMYMAGADFLEAAGYLQYEISNFSRMGFQCRHNLGYWEGQEYLGLGPAAVSTITGRRMSNPADLTKWQEQVKKAELPADLEILSPETLALELVMLRLRTTRGLRVKAYRELTGRNFMRDHRAFLHALHKEGLLRMTNGHVRLSRTGMLVSNTILARLFEEIEGKLALEAKNHQDPVDAI